MFAHYSALLFQFYFCANFFQLLLDRFRFFLFHAFFYVGRSSVYQFLRFFQSQAGNFSYRLDNLDLFAAYFSQNYVELALFVRSASRACVCSCRNNYACCRGYAEFFFTSFNQFV